MKVAFDLDKTYYGNEQLFNHIAKRLKDANHSVGILTARHPDEGAAVEFEPDFVIFLDIGELSYIERAKLKAQKMQEEQIDLIFDDRAELFPQEVVALNITQGRA